MAPDAGASGGTSRRGSPRLQAPNSVGPGNQSGGRAGWRQGREAPWLPPLPPSPTKMSENVASGESVRTRNVSLQRKRMARGCTQRGKALVLQPQGRLRAMQPSMGGCARTSACRGGQGWRRGLGGCAVAQQANLALALAREYGVSLGGPFPSCLLIFHASSRAGRWPQLLGRALETMPGARTPSQLKKRHPRRGRCTCYHHLRRLGALSR